MTESLLFLYKTEEVWYLIISSHEPLRPYNIKHNYYNTSFS